MAFKVAVILGAPDADPDRDISLLNTSSIEVTTVLIQHSDIERIIAICRDLVQQKGIQSFILCPGFTHQAVARIAGAVGPEVSVNIARGDGPSHEASKKIRTREWGTKPPAH